MGNLSIGLVLSTNHSYRLAVSEKHPYGSYAPGTLLRLASLVPAELKADIRLFDLTVDPLSNDIFDSDLVGISTITCGASYAYELADSLRNRGVTVVLGGAHPTALPEEAEAHADSVVVGYAEKSWPKLLHDWQNDCMKKRYTDFSNPFENSLPAINYSLNKSKRYFFKKVIEFSRGCTNHCAFCTVASLNEGNAYFRPVSDAITDARQLGKHVLFLDSNFTANQETVTPLWEALKSAGISWYAAGTLQFAQNPEAVRKAAECGCRGLLIGFESINNASITNAAKPFNVPEQYRAAVSRLHDYGIQVLGCFVFGLDSDGPDIFERTVAFVQNAKIDILRYAIATPFPGTGLYRQLRTQGRIIETDWEYYDTEHVVFSPAGMTVEELYEGHLFAYRETYRVKNIIERVSGCFSLLSLFANLGFRSLAYTFANGHRQTVPGHLSTYAGGQP